MKKNLLLRLCLICLVTLTYSCRTDHFTENETYNNSAKFQLTSKRISLSEAKHKEKLVTELEKVEAELKAVSKSNVNGKIINYGNGVSIDTDEVIYIENETGFHSYTFNIKHENAPTDAPVENLLLSLLPDGSYKELLVSYNLTQQEKQDILAGKSINTNGKATVTELAQGTYGGVLSKNSCNYQTVDMVFSCYTGDHHSGNESTWGGCNWESAEGGYPPLHITMVALVCGADTSLGDDGTPGGGVSMGPVGGFGGENSPTPTQPNMPLPSKGYDPCKQLKNLTDKQAFKDKNIILKDNVNTGTSEKGFVIHDDAATEFSPIINGDSKGEIDYNPYLNQISGDLLYKSYGSSHNHLVNNSDHVGVFTDKDLNNLLLWGLMETFLDNPYRKNTPEKSVIFVNTSIGFFALKITDLEKIRLFCIDFASWNVGKLEDFIKTTYANETKYNIRHNSTHDQQVTGFLRFIKDYNIGIEFYEGNKDTFGNWKKLTLKDNNNGTFGFTETPCPL